MTEDALLISLLGSGLAHCRAVVVDHGNLLGSLFVAGLVGSIGHCVGMCGPFVLAQTVARLESVPARQMSEFHRLTGAALVPYHLGRMTTYAALGVFAASLAQGMIAVTGLRWISAILLLVAAFLFLGYGLQRLRAWWPGSNNNTNWWGNRISAMARPLFSRPVGWRGYLLGVALGFIPCGLLYGAIAGAAASGSALAGGLAMLAFALGTVPALVGIGLAGHVAGTRWRAAVTAAMPFLMVLNAVALSYLAWRTIA